jgi:phosphatidylglycerol lysyltransferase
VTDALDALCRYGSDAVSFQSLLPDLQWWRDSAASDGTGAAVAYLDAGRSWIAVGTPLAPEEKRAGAAARFVRAARASHRRAVFFGVERLEPFAGCRRLALGLQSVLEPSRWDATLRRSPKLREQLRRARAKHVTVRFVSAGEVAPGTALRGSVERLRDEWLASRAMEPMAFLVTVDPFEVPDEHLYLLAERDGRPVQFLSAVPIYSRHGWLMEHMLRGIEAPNGTTELVIDALMRRLGGDPYWVTPGLTPLTGDIPWWLRLTRDATRPLYDFAGLRRFRARLSPSAWRPIWLVWDRGPAVLVLLDVLRAFAGGRMLPFVWRSLVRHPNGPPWAIAVPLVGWTALLTMLSVLDQTSLLGFSPGALRAWIVFDAVLACLLFKVARKPRRRELAIMAATAAFDAVVSIRHLLAVGFGLTIVTAALRLVATGGPVLGTTALVWAWWRARRR